MERKWKERYSQKTVHISFNCRARSRGKPKEILLGSGCLHEQLYRRRHHKEQHCLRLCG